MEANDNLKAKPGFGENYFSWAVKMKSPASDEANGAILFCEFGVEDLATGNSHGSTCDEEGNQDGDPHTIS